MRTLISTLRLTSHGARKGSASYVVSFVGLARVLAVFRRAGWRPGAVLPIYQTQEMDGDQTVPDISWVMYTSQTAPSLQPAHKNSADTLASPTNDTT